MRLYANRLIQCRVEVIAGGLLASPGGNARKIADAPESYIDWLLHCISPSLRCKGHLHTAASAAVVARISHLSFSGCPAWPFTQW